MADRISCGYFWDADWYRRLHKIKNEPLPNGKRLVFMDLELET